MFEGACAVCVCVCVHTCVRECECVYEFANIWYFVSIRTPIYIRTFFNHICLFIFIGQVSQVKGMLLRFAKSQLDGTALKNAFAAAKLEHPDTLKKQESLAEKIVTKLTIGLKKTDGSSSTCTFEYLVDLLKDTATEEQLEAIMDHYHLKFAAQNYQKPDIIGARAYR